ncbi:MAG: hypothetical protein MUC72_03020 [Acidobacteria bacterium]|nr:hypothetical protein [Acidobacteriota bacterium]
MAENLDKTREIRLYGFCRMRARPAGQLVMSADGTTIVRFRTLLGHADGECGRFSLSMGAIRRLCYNGKEIACVLHGTKGDEKELWQDTGRG